MKTLCSILFAGLILLPAAGHSQADTKPTTPVRPIAMNVDVNQAEKLIKDKKPVVLDIRTEKEYKAGHIAGAKNIDFYATDFEKQIATLDKSQSYLVHCAAGGRSGKSMEIFKKLNFQTVYHLDAGFNGWKDAGKPVEK
jgi:phage shock protein E